jgi:hypothetical protein
MMLLPLASALISPGSTLLSSTENPLSTVSISLFDLALDLLTNTPLDPAFSIPSQTR